MLKRNGHFFTIVWVPTREEYELLSFAKEMVKATNCPGAAPQTAFLNVRSTMGNEAVTKPRRTWIYSPRTKRSEAHRTAGKSKMRSEETMTRFHIIRHLSRFPLPIGSANFVVLD